jgi:hypothetical protein
MSTDAAIPATPKWMFWTGWVLSVLTVPLFLMSAFMKISKAPVVVEGFKDWPADVALTIGIVELACVVLYLIPHTAVLGAVLLTGYLGGAVATHVRQGESIIMPVAFGIIIWLGLFFRDPRVRALLPYRTPMKPS